MNATPTKKATRIFKAHNRPEAKKQRRNGAEEMRTMLLSELHHRVGICITCQKSTCPDKAAGSTLPDEINTDALLKAIEEVGGRLGLGKL